MTCIDLMVLPRYVLLIGGGGEEEGGLVSKSCFQFDAKQMLGIDFFIYV